MIAPSCEWADLLAAIPPHAVHDPTAAIRSPGFLAWRERAREQARILADQAIRHLDLFLEKADPLRAVARFVVDRRS